MKTPCPIGRASHNLRSLAGSENPMGHSEGARLLCGVTDNEYYRNRIRWTFEKAR